MVKGPPAFLTGSKSVGLRWARWVRTIIRQRQHHSWFWRFTARPASGVSVRAHRAGQYWRIYIDVAGGRVQYEFWASHLDDNLGDYWLVNDSPYEGLPDAYSRAFLLVREDNPDNVAGYLSRLTNRLSVARCNQDDAGSGGVDIAIGESVPDSATQLPAALWSPHLSRRPLLTWWAGNDARLPVYSEPGAYTVLSGIGLASGATNRRTATIYDQTGFDRVIVNGITVRIESAADSELRAACTQTADDTTYLIVTDHRGRFLIAPLPTENTTLPRSAMTIIEPSLPGWCDTTFFINYRFNSSGTRAVCCLYQSTDFFTSTNPSAYPWTNAQWLCPDGQYMATTAWISANAPMLDTGDIQSPQQQHPGLVEMSITITDGTPAVTLAQQIAPSAGRWVICADYAFPGLAGVDEDDLVVCELVLTSETDGVVASDTHDRLTITPSSAPTHRLQPTYEGYDFTPVLAYTRGASIGGGAYEMASYEYLHFAAHLRFAVDNVTVHTLPLCDRLSDAPKIYFAGSGPTDSDHIRYKGQATSSVLETPNMEFNNNAPLDMSPEPPAGFRCIDAINCRALAVAARLSSMRKAFVSDLAVEYSGPDYFYLFARDKLVNELWVNGQRKVAQPGGDFEVFDLALEPLEYTIDSTSNKYLYLYWMWQFLQPNAMTDIAAHPDGGIACCAVSAITPSRTDVYPQSYIDFHIGELLVPMHEPDNQIQGVDAILRTDGKFATTHLDALRLAFPGLDASYGDYQTLQDNGALSTRSIVRHGNPGIVGYYV